VEPERDRLEEECRTSEITVLPDGRVYVFGMSEQLLAVFDHLRLGGEPLQHRLAQRQVAEPGPCQAEASRRSVIDPLPRTEEPS
jgi:hypothetical protein